jgi:hypothetical protein
MKFKNFPSAAILHSFSVPAPLAEVDQISGFAEYDFPCILISQMFCRSVLKALPEIRLKTR